MERLEPRRLLTANWGSESGTGEDVFPWTNPRDRFDVNDDGKFNFVDAFVLIDALRLAGIGAALSPEGPGSDGPFVDINSNGRVDLADAFLLIKGMRDRGVAPQPPTVKLIADITSYDAFPATEFLANGDMLVVFRGGAAHEGADGGLFLSRSTDGGNQWASEPIYDNPGVDDRVNVGLTQLSNGVLLLPMVECENLTPTDAFVLRSLDNGRTWTRPPKLSHDYTGWLFPYGKILERESGVIEMPYYAEQLGGVREIGMLQSSDQGVTWSHKTIVHSKSQGLLFGEMTVVAITDSHYVAIYRDVNELRQKVSLDGGATWGEERRLFDGVSPELLKLTNGQLLLCVGDREGQEGIRCHVSDDDGATWSSGVMVATSKSGTGVDGGYPASFELSDGNVLTAFYNRAGVSIVTYSPSYIASGGDSRPQDSQEDSPALRSQRIGKRGGGEMLNFQSTLARGRSVAADNRLRLDLCESDVDAIFAVEVAIVSGLSCESDSFDAAISQIAAEQERFRRPLTPLVFQRENTSEETVLN